MIVVSDTSPLCYLILLGQIEVLPTLYQNVLIPQAVAAELRAAASPPEVRAWITHPPSWLQVQSVELSQSMPAKNLDLGEREAIAIAEQLSADLIILDDKAARQFASNKGLKVIGLLGILKESVNAKLLDLEVTFEQLRSAGFWVSPQLLKQLLDSE